TTFAQTPLDLGTRTDWTNLFFRITHNMSSKDATRGINQLFYGSATAKSIAISACTLRPKKHNLLFVGGQYKKVKKKNR
ncbi:MAG: hypothetical protein WBN36_04150, partial [Gammaproteobacteria bacterium]